MNEVNLLKALNHPNIVAYKTSFITQGLLIIIMEYCEVGDLSYHIKRKLQKNESFTETEIFNWFVQLCLALEYIHGRKVLHRDLKTQNIFLTGNNTVKLGDFGISKVLENTGPAQTVVGTPYYMSPEICQNQPYTFKSDVWALGCVLYELCTLKHAFSADNLLGLVYKIVQDKYEPIPDHYSKDLQNLIQSLLNKNAQERPSVAQILQMPVVRQKMIEFVNNGGQTIHKKKPVYVRNVSTVLTDQVTNDQHSAQVQQPNDQFLTPAERLKRRKLEEIRKREEELKAHAILAKDNYNYAKQMQYNQLYSNANGHSQKPLDQTAIHRPAQQQPLVQQMPQIHIQQQHQQQLEQTAFHHPQIALQSTQKSDKFDGTSFSANDRDDLEFSQTSMGATMISQHDSPSKFNNPSVYQVYEERKLTGKGNYDLTYTQSEFDIEEDLEEIIEAKEDKQHLNNVIDNYQKVLNGIIEQCDDYIQTPKKSEIVQKQVESKEQLVGNNRLIIQNSLGEDLYRRVYEFLKFNRRKGTNEASIHLEIKKMVGGDKKLMNHCFNLDGIVFMELLKEQ